MIVRNESDVIERCLRSVTGIIDSWVICDTGSTDGTQELVREQLAGLPGELHERPWRDFGHNRSELMDLARDSADYLLLIDADMTVRQQAPLPELSADAYVLDETSDRNPAAMRLVRGDRRWWYEGSTYEYLATDSKLQFEQLDSLLIEHHTDGSTREKILRDIALLKRDLARDPNNRRSVFCLAQAFSSLGQRDLAIRYYRRRVGMGGWDEEVFYANLQEGILRTQISLDSALPVLLEAWERRPTRAEPLYELARAYRLRGDLALAHLFADRGLDLPYPADLLFVDDAVYRWGLLIERAFAAAGLGRTEEARADLQRLLQNGGLPRETDHRLAMSLVEVEAKERSAPHDRRRVERLTSIAPSTQLAEIELDVRPAWPTFNPSIAVDGDGFRMVVRTANYKIDRGVFHSDGVTRSINYLVSLDDRLGVNEVEAIVDRSSGPQRYPSRVQGYEDCRLVKVDGNWYVTASAADLNPDERLEMALLKLDGVEIADVKPLVGPSAGRPEKNWMPLVLDRTLHFVYSCGPTILLRCDVETGALEKISEQPAQAARTFRGGSQGVPVEDGGHLFVVHEVDHSRPTLQYLHRFVLLDERFSLAATSRPFTFVADQVEFCAGMARRDGELVLSFGVSDAAAGLAVVSVDEALGLLEPVSPRQGRGGVDPAGSATVWSSQFPFKRKGIGQSKPSVPPTFATTSTADSGRRRFRRKRRT